MLTYLKQHNVVIVPFKFWMWNVLGHLDPLLTFLLLASVMCSKYYCDYAFPAKQEKQYINCQLYLALKPFMIKQKM